MLLIMTMVVGTGGVLLSGIADGLELIVRSHSYRKNDEVLHRFRKDLESAMEQEPFERPSYGVVTTTYKNPKEIHRTLSNLIKAVGIDRSDIVVVDDHSDDGGKTAWAARKFGVTVLEMPENTKKVGAQRRGVEELLKGSKRYAVTLDSDTLLEFDKSTLENAMIEMDIFGLDAVAGRLLPEVAPEVRSKQNRKKRLLEKFQYIEYNQAMRLGRGSMYSVRENKKNDIPDGANARERLQARYRLESGRVLCVSGGFGIYNTKTLKSLLDEQEELWVGEDFEHTLRVLGENKNVGYNDTLVAKTMCPGNLRDFNKQRVLWAEGFFRLHTSPEILKKLYKDEKGRFKLDRAGATMALQLARDIGMQPLRLSDVPLMVIMPEAFIPIAGFYAAANAYACAVSHKKGEPVYPLASAALPLYRAYNVFVPNTLGYAKNAIGRIKKHIEADLDQTGTASTYRTGLDQYPYEEQDLPWRAVVLPYEDEG